jgi:radical SAM PhpK family P-methyltransferase
VVGGPFIRNIVSAYRHKQDELDRMLNRIGADYIVYSSEGEETLSKLIAALKNGERAETVPNVYYRENGSYRYTYEAAENHTLEKRMSDWRYFKDHIPELVNIRTTKSCPFDCAFCGLPVAGGKWKRVPNEEIEEELRALHETGKKPGIFFIDETLNFPVPRFKEMLQMMIRNNFGFKWEAEIRCDTLDRETVALMKESGCQLVHLGIESGSQQVLNNMVKRVNIDDYYRAMDLLHEYDILTSALILVGFPGETEETFRDTFNFIETAQPTLFRVHRWFYDHDTPVHAKREEYKIDGGGYNWEHYTMNSTTAHELSTELSLNVRNSIHTDDYSMAFYLLNKGYKKENVKYFLKLFDLAVKEKCSNGSQENIDQYVEKMKTALN